MNGGVLGVTNTPTTSAASGVWTLCEQQRWQQGAAWPNREFIPVDLFSAGEQGVWYDPSDFSTMFQDSAGTTPVTAVEQPVGLLLDKSGRGNHASQSTTTSRPILRNLYNFLICQTTMATQDVGVLAASYTLRFTGDGTVTLSGTATGTLSAGSNTFVSTAGTLTLTVSGTVSEAMLTPTNEASLPFQSVTSNTLGSGVYDSDTNKFKPYLHTDADDWMSTGNVDFSSTDKISVFAGVTKITNGNYGNIIELSSSITSNNGAFRLAAPFATNNNDYIFSSKGTTLVNNLSDRIYTPPITNVVSGIGSISGETTVLRVNSLAYNVTGSQGTGNYGNYPLYLIRRNGTGNSFSGRIYSLIVRGALTSSPQLEQTEQWVAAKAEVTL